MDQAAQKELRASPDNLDLPVRQLDLTLVLLARSVLREEARPTLRVSVDLHAVVRLRPLAGRIPKDILDRSRGLVDDPRVGDVEHDAQLEDVAPMHREATIPEVQPE